MCGPEKLPGPRERQGQGSVDAGQLESLSYQPDILDSLMQISLDL